jgi:hypothetical protein
MQTIASDALDSAAAGKAARAAAPRSVKARTGV